MTSSQAKVATGAGSARRTRRVSLRRLRWSGLGLLVGLAVLYALLPWLIPKRWLADRIAADIARAMNRATRIDTLAISWTEGVTIAGLTIDRREGFGQGPFVRVRRVQTEFSPLAALLGRPIAQLRLSEPEVWVVIITEDGVQRLNIADLGQEGTEHAPTGAWSAVNAAIHIVEETFPPGAEGSMPAASSNGVSLRLGQLACHLDAETGRARWEIRGQAPSGPLTTPASSRPSVIDGVSTDGALTMPKLKKGAKLRGGGRVSWQRLDLATLPVHLLPGSTVRRLTGLSEGSLDVRVHEDLQLDVEFRTTLSDVAVYHRDHDQPDRLSTASLAATGRWNPSADVLLFSQLDCRLPGVHVRTRERPDQQPIYLALRGERLVDMDLIGAVTEVERLRRSLPKLDHLLGPDTETSGACDFELRWRRMTTGDRLTLALDATQAHITHADAVRSEAGQPASVRVDLSANREMDTLDLREIDARLGALNVRAGGRIPLSAIGVGDRSGKRNEEDAWERVLREARGEIRIETQSAEQIRRCLPVLDEPLHDVQLSGPMALTLSVGPEQGEGTALRGYLDVPAASGLRVGEAFVKPPTDPLSASLQVLLAREPRGTLRNVGLDVRCGQGRAWIDPAASRARLAVQRVLAGSDVAATQGVTTQPDQFRAHAYVAGTVQIQRIEAFLAAMPRLSRGLGRDDVERPLSGNCSLSIEANLASLAAGRRIDPELWRVHATMSAGDLGVDLGDRFRKPAGEQAEIAWDYFYDRSQPTLYHRHVASLESQGLTGVGRYVWGGGDESGQLDVAVADVRAVMRHAAELARRAEPYQLRGGLSMTLRSRRDPRRHVLDLDADATSLGFHVPGQDPIDKAPGVPCRLAAGFESRPERDPNQPNDITVRNVLATIASCRLGATEGRIVTRPGTHQKLSAQYTARHPRWWLETSPFRQVNLTATGRVVFDSTLRQLSPSIDRLAQRYDLIGSADAKVQLVADPQHMRLAGRIDAGRMHVNAAPHLVKPSGTALTMTFDVATRELPDRPETTTAFVVHECGLRAWDMRFDGSGSFWLQHGVETSMPQLGGFAMSATYDVPQLSHLQQLAPALLTEPITGAVRGEASLVTEGKHVRIETSTLEADHVETVVGRERVRVHGRMSVSSDRASSEGLELRLGENRLILAGQVDDLTTDPRGSVFVLADDLDLDALQALPSRLQPRGQATNVATTQTVDQQRMASAQPLFDLLKRCDIAGRAHIGHARVTGEKTRKLFEVDELVSDFKVAAGRIVVPFRCALNGGLVDGSFMLTADQANPSFDLTYKAVGIGAKDNVKAMVLYDFPGLHARGNVTLIDATHQKFFNEPGVLNHPVGEGELIIEGGTYVGRAVPIELARLFPGLNTARYEFVRMHDWFRKHVDGRIDHHMIYKGSVYNIYMKGHSKADGWSFYEVGIDLLAGYDSKYWSETGQGRVALFTARAKVEDGVEVEKIIRFVPPHRVLYDVLKSNVLTTAYFALKRQVTQQP